MSRPTLDPAGFFRRIPLEPHQLVERITPAKDIIVLCHLGVPRLSADSWSLTIDGLVSHPSRLSFADLLRYPKHRVTSFHQCAGSPLAPREPTRRITNVRWAGARLVDVLEGCGVSPDAKYLWSSGVDHGEFGGVSVDSYVKDLPIERLHADVLIAYELNDAALPAENGFPARLVVPGFYGTNSVKWLSRITLKKARAPGPFTTRWYNDPVLDAAGRDTGTTTPVWAIAPESVIVSPAPGAVLERGVEHRISGWAWADAGISKVDVVTGEGETWLSVDVETRVGRGWQGFVASWRPASSGAVSLYSLAHSSDGHKQPLAGWRNAAHHVAVTVV
jgi:DMSO/TMAO reductase YedYZ molybdopterin-dependent catalytic subunit